MPSAAYAASKICPGRDRKPTVNVVQLEGLNNNSIGGCKDLQDCVLTIHHSYMNAFANSAALKIVENHTGAAMITNQVIRK